MENNEPKPGYLGPNLDGHKEPVPKAAWEQIEAGLNKRKRRGFFFWLLGGMGVLLLGTGIWFTQREAQTSELAIQTNDEKETKVGSKDGQPLSQTKNRPAVEKSDLNDEPEAEKLANQSEPKSGKQVPKADTKTDNDLLENSIAHFSKALDSTEKETVLENTKFTHIQKRKNLLGKAPLSITHANKSSKRAGEALKLGVKSSQSETNASSQPIATKPEIAEEDALATKKTYAQEATKQEGETKQPPNNEVPVNEKQNEEIQKPEPLSENATGNQEKLKGEPVSPAVALIPVTPPENEKMNSASAKVDSGQKKEVPLIVSTDSINPKPDTTQVKPWKRDPFWLFSVNAGVMQQCIQIIQSTLGYFVQKGSPIVTQNSKDVSPAPSVRLAFGRLWPIIRSFHLGLDVFANGFFQQASAVLTPSTGSPIQYQYGSDSLSIIAKTDFFGQKETYSRKTLMLGLNVRFQWKPKWSPIGIQGRRTLFSYKLDWPHESADVFEASNNYEIGLWLPFKKTHQISLDFNRILWNNQSLPIPVENRGKNWIISLGFSWQW